MAFKVPGEAGGFSFSVPFSGIIQNLQISLDLFVASTASINIFPLIYEFTVYRSSSSPNNGLGHPSSSYVTTPLTSLLTFGPPGSPMVAGSYYSATNINAGSLAVTDGDRIGVRIRTLPSSDISASDFSQVSFSASLFYVY
jgi:hypothetical protein